MRIDRTNRMLLLTAMLLLGATGLRIWQDSQPPAPLWSLTALDLATVTAVEMQKGEERLVIEKADSGWMLREPRELTADKTKLENLLRDWAKAWGPDLKLMEDPDDEDLVQFGLDAASRTELHVRVAGGEHCALELGKGTTGGSQYLRRVGDHAVYRGRVPGSWQLKLGEDEWRDKRLFPFEKDDLSGLDLKTTTGTFRFVRTETEKEARWSAVAPTDFDVSSRQLDVLGRALAGLKAQRILEGTEAIDARTKAGLEAARVRVVATTEGGKAYVLSLGAEADVGRTTYAGIDGDERVFVLTMATFRQLDKKLDDLRDKTVVHFVRDDAVSVEWSEGGRTVRIEPDGEHDWDVKEPVGFDPGPKDLVLAANSLLNLQAAEIVDGADAGLLPDGPVVTVTTKDGSKQVLRLGAAAGDGKIYARVDGRSPTFILRTAVTDRLAKTFRRPE